MAGSGKAQVQSAFVDEVTQGTIPGTPGFSVWNGEIFDMKAVPKITEDRTSASGYRLDGLGKAGYDVSGTASGKLRYGLIDRFLEITLQASWSSNELSDGVDGINSIAIENSTPAGVGGTETMYRYRGVEATKGTVTFKAEEDVNFSFDLMGTGSDDATETAISGATYGNANTNPVIASGSQIGTVTMGSLTLPCMESLTIEFDMSGPAAKEPQPRMSSDDLCGIGRGALDATLTGVLYFEDGVLELYNAMRDGDEFAVNVPVGDVTGQKYNFEFPRCRLIEADPDYSGNSVFQPFTIKPMYSASDDAVVVITRAIA